MSFSLVNAGTWAIGDKLLASQMNALDADHIKSADKSAAGDSILGHWQFTLVTSKITLKAAATLGMVVEAGSKIDLSGNLNGLNGSQIAVASGGTLATASGSTVTIADGTSSTIVLAGGSTITTKTGTTGKIILGDGPADIEISPTVSRSIVTFGSDVFPFVSAGISTVGFIGSAITVSAASVSNNPTIAFGSFRSTVANTNATQAYYYLLPLRRPHVGATLSSAVMYFIPDTTHGALPGGFPSFGLYRTKKDYSAIAQPLKSSGSGIAQYTTASLPTYTSGTAVSVTFTPDQNNVIDPDYFYFAYIWEEYGANAILGNRYCSIDCTYSAISNMAFA